MRNAILEEKKESAFGNKQRQEAKKKSQKNVLENDWTIAYGCVASLEKYQVENGM